ncbi:MAG: hypothetical protein M4D80_34905 [Myxococcota bacterium]|nr:hypothetical protein [Myxococcota bacterium]
METRNILLVVAGFVLIVACVALARGWMQVAEQAGVETQKCESRQRKRVADIPRIIVGTDIVYRGEALISVNALRSRSVARIDELYDRLKLDRRTDCDASVVCLDNLIVLELVTSLDAQLANLIVNTAWAAGYDVIASSPRNNTW